ncbi:hypothetical protein HYFRA_00002280 [Hymenoscyphus fraxineus]|uniref:Uncharacterized protein n=1 Tax=Hymenoscyphus fraxineus TaxID=746836 RepID=A0A9N9L7Y2_9HELO|nr:hypothetical protein HYFRA_00002280 [Hymenoscyphus fraxineus]
MSPCPTCASLHKEKKNIVNNLQYQNTRITDLTTTIRTRNQEINRLNERIHNQSKKITDHEKTLKTRKDKIVELEKECVRLWRMAYGVCGAILVVVACLWLVVLGR